MSVNTKMIDGIRAWVDSVRDQFNPREQLTRDTRQIPETFLAAALRYIDALCERAESDDSVAVDRDVLTNAIEALRSVETPPSLAQDCSDAADLLQFGSSKEKWDQHRCRLCDKVMGGDSKHACWRKNDDGQR